MSFENFTKLLLAGASLLLGSFLTAVRSKLTSAKQKNTLHIIFYTISAIIGLAAIYGLFSFWDELFKRNAASSVAKIDWFSLTVVGMAIVAASLLAVFTYKNLAHRHQYKSRELDPIINKFTEDADTQNIRLIAGDLNFFGTAPAEMDNNSQYQCLKAKEFRSIQLLCFEPKTNVEKIRYGKIISELKIELRFYKPQEADLNIRGRLKTLDKVTYLSIFNKVSAGTYELLEMDTANHHGALYDHIWRLLWQLAEPLSQEEKEEYNRVIIGFSPIIWR